MGHKVTVPKSRRPNLKLTAEQEKLATKVERYVYSPNKTRNPEYSPIPLEVDVRKQIPTYRAVKYSNNSDTPMLVILSFSALEADAVQLTVPCGATRKTVVTSRPDDVEQRQNRPIIGNQMQEAKS